VVRDADAYVRDELAAEAERERQEQEKRERQRLLSTF